MNNGVKYIMEGIKDLNPEQLTLDFQQNEITDDGIIFISYYL